MKSKSLCSLDRFISSSAGFSIVSSFLFPIGGPIGGPDDKSRVGMGSERGSGLLPGLEFAIRVGG